MAQICQRDTRQEVRRGIIQRGAVAPHIQQTQTIEQSTGNRLKFKLEFMMMMLMSDRRDEAAKMYDQLIEEFDKLA